MKTELPTIEARRARLREWINTHFGGSQSAFVASTGVNQGELSGLLKTKSFGEKRAASLEVAAKMPQGYLVNPLTTLEPALIAHREDATEGEYLAVAHLDVMAGMGDGYENSDYPETVGKIYFAIQFLRKLLGFVPRQDRLVLIDGRGDSMLPTIQSGDKLLVDTGINHYERDGLYLINLGHGVQIKRLVDRGAALHVCSDNPIYEAFPLPEGALIVGRIYLINRLIPLN